MSQFRMDLVDRMIRIYGFESEIVISFCRLCESYSENRFNDQCLRILVEAHEASPYV